MKTLLISFFISLSYSCYCQSTDKYIRIVGNSSIEHIAAGAIVSYDFSEVLPNEYKQIAYKSLDDVHKEFVSKITTINLKESDLKKVIKSLGRGYEKTISQSYELSIQNISSLHELKSIEIDGVQVKEFKYTYKNPGIEIEEQLALQAINDAKRKANFIADKSGFKVGKILNIEDFSSGCCIEIPARSDASVKLPYKVNVTFELISL